MTEFIGQSSAYALMDSQKMLILYQTPSFMDVFLVISSSLPMVLYKFVLLFLSRNQTAFMLRGFSSFSLKHRQHSTQEVGSEIGEAFLCELARLRAL